MHICKKKIKIKKIKKKSEYLFKMFQTFDMMSTRSLLNCLLDTKAYTPHIVPSEYRTKHS